MHIGLRVHPVTGRGTGWNLTFGHATDGAGTDSVRGLEEPPLRHDELVVVKQSVPMHLSQRPQLACEGRPHGVFASILGTLLRSFHLEPLLIELQPPLGELIGALDGNACFACVLPDAFLVGPEIHCA